MRLLFDGAGRPRFWIPLILGVLGFVCSLVSLLMSGCASGGLHLRQSGITADEVNREIARVVSIWDAALAAEGHPCTLSSVVPDLRIVWVEKLGTMTGKFDTGSDGIFKTGLMGEPPTIWVLTRHPVSSSALGHELGHAALWACGLRHDAPHCGLRGSPEGCKPEDDLLWQFRLKHGVPW